MGHRLPYYKLLTILPSFLLSFPSFLLSFFALHSSFFIFYHLFVFIQMLIHILRFFTVCSL
ncbi:hypothetical protein BCR41DRAFT_349915 [Lobosporangium transversale]|uniref:Uncharacterized protein n=1 Tax=Lobosporangium transversale TaxID=64571 RepID=A0A1Y2GTT5_9FUNG|nr:hypothetical protein BCR41DRAFT_349915 [Lobosporangium transversale]ORZ22927.1 hypothetical protein BCR41DRAFT_349915 [Lobosporangium transversale]|eukprot:XP_021883481.1 hypothetical protein BCR41DRAFT_349915 [Lobosporangium transversale]